MEFKDSTGQVVKTKSSPLFTTPQAQKVSKVMTSKDIKTIGDVDTYRYQQGKEIGDV